MIQSRRILTGTVFSSMFFLGIVISIVGAAARNIGLSPVQIGFLLSIQNVGFMVGILLAGWFGEAAMKSRVMMWGSLVLVISFASFYAIPTFWVNMLVMLLMGIGIGLYEGTSDSILMDIHQKNESLYININHLFVTLGSLGVTLYLVFLQMSWRRSMVQAAIGVMILIAVFGFSRTSAARGAAGIGKRIGMFAKEPAFLITSVLLFLCVGAQLTIQGVITTYLMGYRGHDQITSKLVAVAFLVGVIAGRAIIGYFTRNGRVYQILTATFFMAGFATGVFFLVDSGPAVYLLAIVMGLAISGLLPLCIALVGLKYRENAGMAVGLIKLAIPLGGIVGPLIFGTLTLQIPFTQAVILFPLFYIVGGVGALVARNKISTVN